MKDGRLYSCTFPKTQQFWIGIPNYCTVRVPHNRVKFQVSKVNDKQSVADRRMATSAEETKTAVGKSPSGVGDGRQHELQDTRSISVPLASFYFEFCKSCEMTFFEKRWQKCLLCPVYIMSPHIVHFQLKCTCVSSRLMETFLKTYQYDNFVLIAQMKPINLSFAACGFLGIYHLGAAAAFHRHGKKLLRDVKAFAGASAGSLAAAVLLAVPENIEKCKHFAYGFAEEVRRLNFGAVTPGYDFMKTLREGIESILPSDVHEIAENRLYVSVTNSKSGENHLVSNFPSREDLIKFKRAKVNEMPLRKRGEKVLLASSFIPVYAGIKPVEFKGQKWIDGGLTNGLPILPVGRTVTISPFSGRLDVCPEDKGRVDLYIKLAKQDMMLSLANLVRLNQALFPPDQEKMELLYQNGFDDAVRFLLKENWFE
ncbi:Patatin-like phospholipase domain-containing protein 4 [Turdus rufiventris]|nr:Patatin-like phospholipase domain-containing protein 4 [Turdus rufiventris]